MARQLAKRHGAQLGLVLAARNEERLAQVASQCTAFGVQRLMVLTDVSLEPARRALIAQTMARFGRLVWRTRAHCLQCE
ncbi:MAG: hypothetical protein ACK44C_02745 [Polaromonas sp.]|jgi:NAD(P)-dependent dehydrogenase (short-subunit alcohol dehydrogenase family)